VTRKVVGVFAGTLNGTTSMAVLAEELR
jgi:hypothetical protein